MQHGGSKLKAGLRGQFVGGDPKAPGQIMPQDCSRGYWRKEEEVGGLAKAGFDQLQPQKIFFEDPCYTYSTSGLGSGLGLGSDNAKRQVRGVRGVLRSEKKAERCPSAKG